MLRRNTQKTSFEIPVTPDGIPLKESVARSQRPGKIRAMLWVLPLLVFIAVTFIAPIASMLLRSVDNSRVTEVLHRTIPALNQWDETAGQIPDEAVFTALATDFKTVPQRWLITSVGRRLNLEKKGMIAMFRKTLIRVDELQPPYRDSFLNIHPGWGDIGNWRVIKRESGERTNSYYLSAMDLRYDNETGHIVKKSSPVYLHLYWRTIWMSALVAFLCAILGFPVAYFLSSLPTPKANVLILLVLFPFWTSLLVRVAAWIVILQNNGVLNELLIWFDILNEEERLQLIYNKIGTVIATTYTLLPLMILPLYSVMKTIPRDLTRAARLMGANSYTAFRRIYFPNTVPGIWAGVLLVFVVSAGYYITPELIGGQSSLQIGNAIVHQFGRTLNWGLAAALATILFFTVMVLYVAFNKLVGIDSIKFR